MLIALWIINILLALAFLAAGGMKAMKGSDPFESAGARWIAPWPSWTIRAIGVAEIVGAIGLIVPLATGIAPVLTPIAAVGLAVVTFSAVVVHARVKEPFVPPLVLASLSAVSAVVGFIALG